MARRALRRYAVCPMIVYESRKSRRLVARLERGEDLVRGIEALAQRANVRAAWVRGTGSLEWVELDRHDQARRAPEPPQRFDLPCDLLTLEGNLSRSGDSVKAVLYATLARRTDNGVDVLGGRVRAASAYHVELVLECFDDLVLVRERDERTGLAVWVGASSEPEPEDEEVVEEEEEEERAPAREAAPVSKGAGVSWADVAAASVPSKESARRQAEEAFMSEPQPQRGDWIQHRQFGLCRVDKEDEDGGLAIRLPTGVRKHIRLDFMEVGQPRMEGDRRIFPVRPRAGR